VTFLSVRTARGACDAARTGGEGGDGTRYHGSLEMLRVDTVSEPRTVPTVDRVMPKPKLTPHQRRETLRRRDEGEISRL
jgi:hypothetical protein